MPIEMSRKTALVGSEFRIPIEMSRKTAIVGLYSR